MLAITSCNSILVHLSHLAEIPDFNYEENVMMQGCVIGLAYVPTPLTCLCYKGSRYIIDCKSSDFSQELHGFIMKRDRCNFEIKDNKNEKESVSF